MPIFTQTGMASWYGTVYHNRKAANGEIFDMNALTAAHRTLPLNSIVRVTNSKTGSVAILRITDRGPFVTDRVIDLSMGAAKVLDVWRPGTAMVKIEVLKPPRIWKRVAAGACRSVPLKTRRSPPNFRIALYAAIAPRKC